MQTDLLAGRVHVRVTGAAHGYAAPSRANCARSAGLIRWRSQSGPSSATVACSSDGEGTSAYQGGSAATAAVDGTDVARSRWARRRRRTRGVRSVGIRMGLRVDGGPRRRSVPRRSEL